MAIQECGGQCHAIISASWWQKQAPNYWGTSGENGGSLTVPSGWTRVTPSIPFSCSISVSSQEPKMVPIAGITRSTSTPAAASRWRTFSIPTSSLQSTTILTLTLEMVALPLHQRVSPALGQTTCDTYTFWSRYSRCPARWGRDQPRADILLGSVKSACRRDKFIPQRLPS